MCVHVNLWLCLQYYLAEGKVLLIECVFFNTRGKWVTTVRPTNRLINLAVALVYIQSQQSHHQMIVEMIENRRCSECIPAINNSKCVCDGVWQLWSNSIRDDEEEEAVEKVNVLAHCCWRCYCCYYYYKN